METTNQNARSNRPQAERVLDKVFTDQATGLTVEVWKLQLRTPKYSIKVGNIGQNGFAPYIRPEVRVENGKVTVSSFDKAVAFLLAEARLYVLDQHQKIEDFYSDRRIERETRQIERAAGVGDVAKTGKTEREAAKRARHEQNLASRRAADAERTSRTKGRSK